jgi:hypothetical protein
MTIRDIELALSVQIVALILSRFYVERKKSRDALRRIGRMLYRDLFASLKGGASDYGTKFRERWISWISRLSIIRRANSRRGNSKRDIARRIKRRSPTMPADFATRPASLIPADHSHDRAIRFPASFSTADTICRSAICDLNRSVSVSATADC